MSLAYPVLAFIGVIPVDPNIEWIKLNHNQRMYYRVMYDSEGWTNIINVVKANVDVRSRKYLQLCLK